MKTQITDNFCHPLKGLWFPGMAGIAANLVLLLVSLMANQGLSGFFENSFFLSPCIATICVGAFVEGFRYFALKRGPARDASVSTMHILDMVLGLLGLCPFVFRALAFEYVFFDLSEIALCIGILLFMSTLGYIFLSRMFHQGVLKITLAVLAWFGYAVISFYFALGTFFGSRDGMVWRDCAVNDLNNLSAQCYQYRVKPKSMKGGGGSYVGFPIPDRWSSNYNGTYVITSLSPDTVAFKGIGTDSSGAIFVKLGPEGTLVDWKFVGTAALEEDPAWLVWIKELVRE